MCTSLPSQDNPLHVTPDNTSRQTLQKVGFAWEHEYQLCAPDNVSNRSDCYKNKNSRVSFLIGDTFRKHFLGGHFNKFHESSTKQYLQIYECVTAVNSKH